MSNEKSSPFGLLLRLSGKRDSSPRFARTILANLYLHPRPLKGASWGRSVRAIISDSAKRKRQPEAVFSILSGKRDSNSRPQPWQGCALPTELFPQKYYYLRLQPFDCGCKGTSFFLFCKFFCVNITKNIILLKLNSIN